MKSVLSVYFVFFEWSIYIYILIIIIGIYNRCHIYIYIYIYIYILMRCYLEIVAGVRNARKP